MTFLSETHFLFQRKPINLTTILEGMAKTNLRMELLCEVQRKGAILKEKDV